MTFTCGNKHETSQVKHREKGDNRHALLSVLPKNMILLLTERTKDLHRAITQFLLSSHWMKLNDIPWSERGTGYNRRRVRCRGRLVFELSGKAAATVQDSAEPLSGTVSGPIAMQS